MNPVASSIGPTQEAGTAYFNVSGTQYLLSNTGLMLGIAFAPMALNPLSELLGRVKTFGISMSLYTLLFIPQTLTKSYAGFIISRLLIGVFGSVASSMIAGTLVDMYGSKTRGRAMNAFTLSIFIGQGVGPAIAAHIAEKTDYRWVWGVSAVKRILLWNAPAKSLPSVDLVYQYQGIASAVGLAWYLSVAKETRPSLPPVEFDDDFHAVSKRWRHLLDAISVSITRPFGA
jgi:MFS family permease